MTEPNFRALCAELVELLEDEGFYGVTREPNALVNARAALEAQPEPQGPTDEEIDQLWDDVGEYFALYLEVRETIRAALRRWGRPAIEPVPVSERLPGPEDCDAEGRCWFYTPSSYVMNANWVCRKAEHRRSWDTHWAPHWALPVPGVEGKP